MEKEILTFKKVFDDLNISQAEAASILNDSQVNISRKISRGDEIKISELQKFQKHFGLNLFRKYFKKFPDAVEIHYYKDDELDELIKNPLVTSVWMDREIVNDVWVKDEKKIVKISMIGDCMDGGPRPIKNGDILFIDTSETNILASGIYAYTTGNSDIFVANIKRYLDKVEFSFFKEGYEIEPRTMEELEELNFTVIGRVIHNQSELF